MEELNELIKEHGAGGILCELFKTYSEDKREELLKDIKWALGV